MKLETFKMERWQSEWEHVVDHNLSESGVHPLRIEEIIPPEQRDEFLRTRLGYIQTDGTRELKERIAADYPGASPENILVTSGSSEANFLCTLKLAAAGSEALFMLPNFLQMDGLLRGMGLTVTPFTLKEDRGWAVDIDELESLVSEKTRIIILTNPNNPTGAIMDDSSRRAVLNLADRSGAWLIVDEVYRGSEADGNVTPSLWGDYERTVITCGLSKAYGLPGLRIGWAVGPRDLISDLWRYKDYISITVSAASDILARQALRPEVRPRILERTRGFIRDNYKVLESWMNGFEGLFTCVPPAAGAIAFPRYTLDIHSTDLALRIKDSHSVLICPGEQFGLDHHIRFGLGEPTKRFQEGLALVKAGLQVVLDSDR